MKRIRFIPAQVKTVPDDRPDACPTAAAESSTDADAQTSPSKTSS